MGGTLPCLLLTGWGCQNYYLGYDLAQNSRTCPWATVHIMIHASYYTGCKWWMWGEFTGQGLLDLLSVRVGIRVWGHGTRGHVSHWTLLHYWYASRFCSRKTNLEQTDHKTDVSQDDTVAILFTCFSCTQITSPIMTMMLVVFNDMILHPTPPSSLCKSLKPQPKNNLNLIWTLHYANWKLVALPSICHLPLHYPAGKHPQAVAATS